ncbi:MAG TPA: hypothetical protein VGR35_08290 [Tepidisphaeraceae bacterium]|nr:hypothetical protein [Tepidisphaeraceae bacterium]
MRHPDTAEFTPDQQATYDEWLWLLTRWGTHTVDEAHDLALRRAGDDAAGDDDRPLFRPSPQSTHGGARRALG